MAISSSIRAEQVNNHMLDRWTGFYSGYTAQELQIEALQQRMYDFSPVMLFYLWLSWRKPAAGGPQAECE